MPDPVTGLIAGAATVGSSVIGSKAAKSAANTQAAAADRAMAQELAMYEQSREDLTPYREMGYGAIKDIERLKPFFTQRFNQPYTMAGQSTMARQASMLGQPALSLPPGGDSTGQRFMVSGPVGNQISTPIDSEGNPIGQGIASQVPLIDIYEDQGGYQAGSPLEEYLDPSMAFRMKYGTQATERLANVGGGSLSGNTMRALQEFGQGLASTEYGNAFNRFQTERQNIYNTLANIAGMGQQSVNTGVQAGQNFAAQQTGLMTGQAAAQAAGQVGSANAYSNALGNLGNMAMLYGMRQPTVAAAGMGGPATSMQVPLNMNLA